MPKSKPRRRDRYDDRPGKEKGGKGLLIGIIACGAVVLGLCVCGGGLGAYFFLGKRGEIEPVKDAVTSNKPAKKRDIVLKANPELGDIANDPKSFANPDLNKLLAGRWRNLGRSIDFRSDGTVEKEGQLFGFKGTCKITGPDSIDITSVPHANPGAFGPKTETYVVVINDDELALFARFQMRDSQPNEHRIDGPYYRMRDDGTGLGRTKFIDPLITRATTGNPVDKANAIGTLGLLGPDAWPAAAELGRLIDAKDPQAPAALGTLAKIGPKAKAAMPSLRRCLADQKNWRGAVMALGAIGPDARDAIPELRKMLPNGEVEGALRRIDPKGKF